MIMLDDLRRTWMLFTPDSRRRAVGILFLVILMALVETAGVLSILPFLSVLGDPEVVQRNPLVAAAYRRLGFQDTRQFTVALGIFSIVFVLVSSAFKVATQHVLNRFVHLQRHSISMRLLAAYLQQPYAFFLERNSSDLSKAILSETDQLLSNLIQPLAQMAAQLVVVVAMVALILSYDPLMAVVLLGTVGTLYAAIYWLVRKRLSRIGAERIAANRERYQACNEALGGIKDVKVTDSAGAYMSRFQQASRTFSRHLASNDTLSQAPLYLVEAVGYSCLILVALLLLARAQNVGEVLPALGLYGVAAYRMLPAAQIIYRGVAKLRFSSAALEMLCADLRLAAPPAAPPGAGAMLVPRHEIRLAGISFAYPSAPERKVIRDLELVVPAYATIGICGRSGAGKSTLMDILLGLLRPSAGQLMVDGVPVDDALVPAWQRSIGYVPQHIFLADASVAANIAFGIPEQEIDMAAVEKAARAAQIHSFVANELAQGYATSVGERGVRLSGGQRQRIGIARALYRDPPILLFDEATSALDAETEHALNESIRALKGKRTMVVIAHKESSLAMCDRVIEVGGARPLLDVADQGSQA